MPLLGGPFWTCWCFRVIEILYHFLTFKYTVEYKSEEEVERPKRKWLNEIENDECEKAFPNDKNSLFISAIVWYCTLHMMSIILIYKWPTNLYFMHFDSNIICNSNFRYESNLRIKFKVDCNPIMQIKWYTVQYGYGCTAQIWSYYSNQILNLHIA